MITLIIKGHTNSAQAKAEQLGIVIVTQREIQSFGQAYTVATTWDSYLSAVVDWFVHENSPPPFDDGELLHYNVSP